MSEQCACVSPLTTTNCPCKKLCFCRENLQIRALRKIEGILLRSPKASQPLLPCYVVDRIPPKVEHLPQNISPKGVVVFPQLINISPKTDQPLQNLLTLSPKSHLHIFCHKIHQPTRIEGINPILAVPGF